jgi:hypothetical protein
MTCQKSWVCGEKVDSFYNYQTHSIYLKIKSKKRQFQLNVKTTWKGFQRLNQLFRQLNKILLVKLEK